jgi:ribulose-phosphate 3-epimerase
MNPSGILETLRQRLPLVAPSMLKCDFGDLAREVRLLDQAGAGCLHWDVMDGHFVPNLSYGGMVIAPLRSRTDTLFEAHLMISDPAKYLDDYISAGCQWITIHVEANGDTRQSLKKIRDAGCVAGLCLNPKTPVEALAPYKADFDTVLVMSVEPGFGGQSFIPSSTAKIQEVRRLVGPETLISVDGGIGTKTIAACAAAGANTFVVGSAIFDRPDYRAALEELTSLARGPHRGS